VPVDFYDSSEWVKHKLGVFHLKEATPQQLEHLKRAVAQAAAFREKLKPIVNATYPPIAVLCSKSHPTLVHIKITEVGKFDFKSLPRKMGDNRVVDAAPFDGIPHTSYETKKSHGELLNDIPLLNKIISDLMTAAAAVGVVVNDTSTTTSVSVPDTTSVSVPDTTTSVSVPDTTSVSVPDNSTTTTNNSVSVPDSTTDSAPTKN